MAKKKTDTTDPTAELLAQILEAQKMAAAQPSAPTGAITGQGIRNWQTIIIFIVMSAVGVGGWLISTAVSGTTKMNDYEFRLKAVESSVSSIGDIKTNQQRTNSDVEQLKGAVNNINKSLESMSGDLKAIGFQINQLTQQNSQKPTK